MFLLSAADIHVDEVPHLGIGQGGINSAFDDAGQGISALLCRHIALAHIHTGGQQGRCNSGAGFLVQGGQFVGDGLVIGRFQEKADGVETQRIQLAFHPHARIEDHAAAIFALRLHIALHLLGGGDAHHSLAQRTVEGNIAFRIHFEGHHRIEFGRIADGSFVHIDLSGELQFAVGRVVLYVYGTVRFHLRQVLFIDGIGDIRGGQDRDIHVGQDMVQRPRHPSVNIGGQVAVDGNGSIRRQLRGDEIVGG